MSGKRKIAYPIDLKFTVGEPQYYNSAEDKYKLHKDIIDKIIDSLKGEFHIGYVRRDKKFVHGINAHSLNEAIRDKLSALSDIEGETNVVFGSFLPPIMSKGEFDFAVYDKVSNFYNFWNHCYGKNAVRDGDRFVDYYIRDEKTKTEWEVFIETCKPKQYEEDLVVPDSVFNIIGEIQFGNWAMVYKDMFRLVSAINKRAKIDLYIYVTASGNLKQLMSDGVVGFEDACKRFEENVENHNINKPVIILPLDIDFELESYDFSEAERGYIQICSELDELEKKLAQLKEKLKELKREKKETKSKEKQSALKNAIECDTQERKQLEQEIKDLKNKYKEMEEFDDA